METLAHTNKALMIIFVIIFMITFAMISIDCIVTLQSVVARRKGGEARG